MQFCDSQLADTTQKLFERLKGEVGDADELHVADSSWLSREDLKRWLEPLWASVEARGGRVKFLRPPTPDRTS